MDPGITGTPDIRITIHVSHEKNLGWLGYTRDYTTQLYRDYNKTL